MGFSDLPLELVYQVAEHLEFERDINALARVSKCFYGVLNGYLYRHNIKVWDAIAFEFACKSGLSKPMRMFLDEGMLLDAYDPECYYDQENWSPISRAAMYGREDIVKCLLEKGVDPNAKQTWFRSRGIYRDLDSKVWGPFDFAIMNGHVGTVRLLVPHMESVDYFVTRESDGKTTLTLAAENGNLDLVKMLVEELKCNVEPTRVREDGKVKWKAATPLACAAACGRTNIVRYLLSVGADLDATVETKWVTPIGNAILNNHLETAKTLIEHGSDPNPLVKIQQAKSMSWGEAGQYDYNYAYRAIIFPLACATNGHLDILKLVFKHIDLERTLQCDVEDVNILLPAAAVCGLEGVVQRLLEKGCDVNTRFVVDSQICLDYAGSALTLASSYGHLGVARILLGHGADPNGLETFGHRKPLAAAVSAGHQQVVELLLEAGANSNTKENDDRNLLTLAAKSEPITKMLLNHGADPPTLSSSAGKWLVEVVMNSQNVFILRKLLDTKFGLPTTEKRDMFNHVMEQAVKAKATNFEYLMQYLWDQYGLKPSPQDNDSQRALESAIAYKNAEVVEIFLLRYGLTLEGPRVVDYLTWAASQNGYGDYHMRRAEAMLDVLLRHGVDINAKRSDGHTCLSLLLQKGAPQGAGFVIRRGAIYPLTYVIGNKCLLAYATWKGNTYSLKLLLGLIDAQGVSSEDIDRISSKLKLSYLQRCTPALNRRAGDSNSLWIIFAADECTRFPSNEPAQNIQLFHPMIDGTGTLPSC